MARNWPDMDRTDFDTSEPLVLFGLPDMSGAPVAPDKCGTPDLFTEE